MASTVYEMVTAGRSGGIANLDELKMIALTANSAGDAVERARKAYPGCLVLAIRAEGQKAGEGPQSLFTGALSAAR